MSREHDAPVGEFVTVKRLHDTVQRTINRTCLDALLYIGVSPLSSHELTDEEVDSMLSFYDEEIKDNFFGNNFLRGRLSPDSIWMLDSTLWHSEHLLPGGAVRVQSIVAMSEAETSLMNPDVPVLSALNAPVKCIIITNSPPDVEPEEYFNYEYWRVFIHPDGPPELISDKRYCQYNRGRPRSDKSCPSDGGWLEGFHAVQQKDRYLGGDAFKVLNPSQCKELINLVTDAATVARAAF